MSRLTEEIRRLSRKLDNLEQRLEKVEESQHLSRTINISASPSITVSSPPEMPTFTPLEPKFKVGDRFIPHKPKDENESPTWGRSMDRYDGETLTVAEITRMGNIRADIDDDYWYFNPSWCTKVEEHKFKKGDWVRSLITGTVGKVEAFYEKGNHSRYLLSTIDGDHFTSRENVLEPYFPKEGEYIYVYFKKSEHRYIVIFSHTNTTYLYDKCSIYLNTDKLEISKIPFCCADLISELRPASAEEKKLLDSKLAEKGLRFDGKEIVKDNTPKVGDFCIFWDNPGFCVCDTLKCIDNDGRFIRDSYGYINCVKFESEEQFRRIKEGKK